MVRALVEEALLAGDVCLKPLYLEGGGRRTRT